MPRDLPTASRRSEQRELQMCTDIPTWIFTAVPFQESHFEKCSRAAPTIRHSHFPTTALTFFAYYLIPTSSGYDSIIHPLHHLQHLSIPHQHRNPCNSNGPARMDHGAVLLLVRDSQPPGRPIKTPDRQLSSIH